MPLRSLRVCVCRESLAKFTKEAPLFLRFLKLVTDVENRPRAFIEYALR